MYNPLCQKHLHYIVITPPIIGIEVEIDRFLYRSMPVDCPGRQDGWHLNSPRSTKKRSSSISSREICMTSILTFSGFTVGVNTAGCSGVFYAIIVSSTIKAELRTAMLRFLTQIRTTKTVSPSRATRFGSSST